MTDPVGSRLVKVTVNLTPAAADALTGLAAGQRLSRTDALNRALRVAYLMHDLAPDGHFRIVKPDGVPVDVYLV
ncbi:hypothetical protein [Micromonospora sp. NPDC004704]